MDIVIEKPIELSSGGNWKAHFSPKSHGDQIESTLPGPVSLFMIVLEEGCQVPDLVVLEIGAQKIAETYEIVPVPHFPRTYQIQFFRNHVSLPLHKLFFHFVEIRVKGTGSYEGCRIVVSGKDRLMITPIYPDNFLSKAQPFNVITPGVDEETVNILPYIGDVGQLIFRHGCCDACTCT